MSWRRLLLSLLIALVVADGRLYTRAQLDAQLARHRRHSEGAIFDALSVVLARRALARILD